MPYDPCNPDSFRTIVQRLAVEEYLSSAAILHLVECRRKGAPNRPPVKMSRSSFDRWRRGAHCRKLAALREIYDVLEAEPALMSYFPAAPVELPIPELDPEEQFLAAFPAFMRRDGQAAYDLNAMGDELSGRYVMYRRHWEPGEPPIFARTSLIEIDRIKIGPGMAANYRFSETQDFAPTESRSGYKQRDAGALGSAGKFIYIFLREAAPGSTTKWGIIEVLYPHCDGSLVDWFYGIVDTYSNVGAFPKSRFFCKRLPAGRNVRSEIMPIDDIPDRDAKAYLRKPLGLPDEQCVMAHRNY